jgi:hypothetical protein
MEQWIVGYRLRNSLRQATTSDMFFLPLISYLMNMGQLVELLAGEANVLMENLLQCQYK